MLNYTRKRSLFSNTHRPNTSRSRRNSSSKYGFLNRTNKIYAKNIENTSKDFSKSPSKDYNFQLSTENYDKPYFKQSRMYNSGMNHQVEVVQIRYKDNYE